MNIILLSGGSGKRLWPLSNDTRSKQFLKLLKNEGGEYESMVQRVYRQIRTAGIQAKIVVATGASQVDSIRSQLGNAVDVVVEPERRDTFPAIALSASFLAFEKHVPDDEAVIVLPVDPYAELEYFHTLLRMEQAVRENAADMVLMGIKPTYPSAKYGYIVPEAQNSTGKWAFPVKKFTEKPDECAAKRLIDEGAVWNGGVFAFKLRYIMNVVHSYTSFSSFDEIRRHYASFRKISFDYEVVEKARSVAMVPYEATWKDLGTWNTLTEEIDDSVIGPALAGEGTADTHIINELSIPIVVLGARNMIVAASPEGILISDKQKSSRLKPYVDRLEGRPMFGERKWGNYRVLDSVRCPDGTESLTRRITVRAGRQLSSQGALWDEIWNILDGHGTLLTNEGPEIVGKGDTVKFIQGQSYSFRAAEDVELISVQTGIEEEKAAGTAVL